MRSVSSSKDLVIAMSVLVVLLLLASLVFFFVWKYRVHRQFAPKKLTNIEMEMDNPVFSNSSQDLHGAGDERVVMEFEKGLPSRFKYFPSKKEKKEKEKKSRIYKDPLGDYSNFTNSEENLTQDEKAMLVYPDDDFET